MVLSPEEAQLIQRIDHVLRRIEANRWLAQNDLETQEGRDVQHYLSQIEKLVIRGLSALALLAQGHGIPLSGEEEGRDEQ